MTTNELQKLIDWVNANVDKHSQDVYEDNTGNFNIVPVVYFNELMSLLAQYPVEESEARGDEKICGPNYEAMYNELYDAHQAVKKRNKELKDEVRSLEYKLVSARSAIAMAEVIYGRQWAPGKLELIR